jgi:hypothetical protein
MENTSTTWQEREAERQVHRKLPVWIGESWWQDNGPIWEHHYLHVSASDSRLLAYTQDANKGARDIQTPIKPGKYLAKFFAGILSEKQIAFYAAWQSTGRRDTAYSGATLSFARDSDDIVRVYRNGPYSCMTTQFDSNDHPCQVYGAGDLAIAYLTQGERIIARALCWPENKVIGRIYPCDYNYSRDGFASVSDARDAADALFSQLKANGYSSDSERGGGSFDGARLLKLDHDNSGYLMPYLDHDYGVDDRGEFWTMSSSPEHACQETSGRISGDDEPEYEFTCDNCEEGVYEGDGAHTVYTGVRRSSNGRLYARGEQTWCEHCADNNSFYCSGVEERFDSNSVDEITVGSRSYCSDYAEEHFVRSDYSDDWYDREDTVTMANGETWGDDEFRDNGFTCEITGENYPDDEMHPDHPNVWNGVDVADLESWLELRAATNDSRQLAMAAE